MLGKNVRQLREAKGWSQGRLGKLAGCSQQIISNVELGKTPQPRELHRIAQALGVTIPELYGRPTVATAGNVKFLDNQPRVPILHWNMVSSWTKGGVHDLPEDVQYTEYRRGGPRTFAVEVRGDSMIGSKQAFVPGELVHVDPDQTDPEPGMLVLAELPDGVVTFKELRYEDGRYYLHSLNPHFQPIFDDFTILGRAVAKTMDL